MIARAVYAAADVIHRAQVNGAQTAAGLAFALESAQMLVSPEAAHQAAEVEAERDALKARVAELESAAYGDATVRLFTPVEQIRHLHAAVAAQLSRADTLDRLCREKQDRVAELETERHSTNEALSDITVELRKLQESPLMAYRASHKSIVLGHYTTREAARDHCQKLMERASVGTLEWRTDGEWREDDGGEPGPDEAEELYEYGTHESATWDPTGYVVTPLEAAAAYDEGADE